MTASTTGPSDIALTLLAAARRLNTDRGRDLLWRLIDDDSLDRVHAVGVGLWCARWLAGRAGRQRWLDSLTDRGDHDDPEWAARTLTELRRGVVNNPSRDVWVDRHRRTMVKILDLVEQTGPQQLPPRAEIEDLLATAGDAAGERFLELGMPARGWGEALLAADRAWFGRHDVILRLVELVQMLAALDARPMYLLDVLASQLLTIEMEFEND